jgi:hypothetical protein
MQTPLPKLSESNGTASPHYWTPELFAAVRKRRAAQERRRLRRAGVSEAEVASDPVARYQEPRGSR